MAQVFWFLLITAALAFSNILPLLTPVVAATDGAVAPAIPPDPAIPPYPDIFQAPAIPPHPSIPPDPDIFPAPFPFLTNPPPPPPPPSGCSSKCGDIDIPYPFGIGYDNDCSWHGAFNLICNTSFDPPQVYVGNVKVDHISLEAGEMLVYGSYSHVCEKSEASVSEVNMSISFGHTSPTRRTVTDTFSIRNSSFLISSGRNEFTAIGCNTVALLKGRKDWEYKTGCISYCVSVDDAAQDGEECNGLGCCQTSISGNLNLMQVDWNNNGTVGSNPAQGYSPCSYAFVAEKGWYRFKRDHLISRDDGNGSFVDSFGKGHDTTIPLVLDWAIRDDGYCRLPADEDKAPAGRTASACVSLHSYCVNATQGPGYLCKCSDGYAGNPYVKDGCTNINECELRKLNPAQYEKQYPCGSASTCHDTQGDYVCTCKFWYRGDGKSDKGCQPIVPVYAIAIVATFVTSIIVCVMIMEVKRRKQKKFFDKNGGEILQSMGIKIFTERQMKKITNGYSTPIGEGSFGKVYMGTIGTDQKVAVKCAIMKAKQVLPKEEFVNEIIFQFRISHANLVRLVGCCLETYVPMLVFEFVPKGSLYNMLHSPKMPNKLLLPARLDIAIGSAEALTYMHSHTGNHVHGDVKSGNILLDENLRPKVSDFGSSKLVSITSKYPKWCVSADMNYIDPVYLKCGRFTEKSDVYSFGVVLLELITRKTAKYGENSLPIDFVKTCKVEGNGRKMFDPEIISDSQSVVYMECLDRMGALAVRCIKEDVDERPTMAEVAAELKKIKLTACEGPCSEAS